MSNAFSIHSHETGLTPENHMTTQRLDLKVVYDTYCLSCCQLAIFLVAVLLLYFYLLKDKLLPY